MPIVITIKKLITPNKLTNANVLSDNILLLTSPELLNIADINIIICVAKNIVDKTENEL